ncbi:hypothetical protein [Shewanella aestuarii]|uniref:Uncharacterized protein n=1 Tax=Shewanella aestuarii TaxID=1028752 RepID=A0A6G9QP26_9GAMM|nr:hypothetical protein [Shewanella aestuarii]QIR16350.1 hypothetical protein HBH39_17850 [Shewanella aestuarii]
MSKYFKIGDDIDDVRYGFGAGQRLKSGLKVFGKSVANVGVFAVTEVLPAMTNKVNKMAEDTLKDPNAKDELKVKAEEYLSKRK